ncbi:MAG: sigma-54-dependent Fis family transcriptional regulator [Candidatus Cloacimonetes bacterium]|jgi:two-component system, NtrC family, response regulator HydG|nr:sigma-54-dependent Fis family transcriptional regulator [Candidatus Cloacimonadota bacterium]MBT6994199.1 sigma-54-dependent Fis family transcriptional regulator [Candidatus Cloacimonadota bacterium]MBT7470280.1 sigma-54-dependent Fis family transcriptional regulator [Candidatus Cloacimonadota bacterium]
MKKRLLIVEDDRDMNMMLLNFFKKKDFIVSQAFDGAEALLQIQKEKPDLVLSDVGLPKMNGFKLLKEIKEIDENIITIMITGFSNVKDAVKAIQLGASDYIAKPFDVEVLMLVIEKAIQTRDLQNELFVLKKKLADKMPKFIFQCKKTEKIIKDVDVVAASNMSVILQGESGTGKELLAKRIHQKSEYHNGPFIAIDCGAIPDSLIESEFFGHEKGAFTGAIETKKGKFEQANDGTIFLDEIANLPLSAQATLLRVIQERKLRKIGSDKTVNVNIRIVTATNVKLLEMVTKGQFREDLYHRLNEYTINIPPLRKRRDDITILTEHFVKLANQILKKNVKNISSTAMTKLLNYNFPGNVRELKNIIQKAILVTDSNSIEKEHLFFETKLKKLTTLKEAKQETEMKLILETLANVNDNKTEAAKILGISRKMLYLKLEDLRM